MRSDAREAAFSIIYADLFHENCDERFKNATYKRHKLSEDERAFAARLVALTEEHREELLRILDEKVKRFAEYRVYPVDKAIMLVALAEIEYCEDIPPVVSVSEASALAQKYSTERSAGFVNGVLGGVING